MTKNSTFFRPDLINGRIMPTLLSFTLPILVSILFQQFYNAADTLIVGNLLGEESLAAVGSCASVNDLLLGFGIGFGNGLGILAARAYGAGDIKKLKKIVASSFILTLIVTLFLMMVSQLTLKPLLLLLGTPEQILEESYSYIWVIGIFCGVMFVYNLLSGLLRAIGNSVMPLVFLIISSVLNIFLDILFISVFNMGVKGSAIATVLSQFISTVLCFIYIVKKAPELIPVKESFAPEKEIYKDLATQGLSMALMSALVNSGTVILQSSINKFGTLIIAGHISARKIFTLTNAPIIALASSASTFVSQNLGAQKINRIKQGVKASYLLSLIFGIICTIVIPLTARFLISIISGSSNEEVIDYGSKYISFMQPFYAVLGVLTVTRNCLQGLGSKLIPLISSIIELIGKILFSWIIIPLIGIWGVIICEPLIWVIMTIQLVIAFITNPIIRQKK